MSTATLKAEGSTESVGKKEKLKDKDLLAAIRDFKHLSDREQAIQCGYVSETKNGQQQVQMLEFMTAIVKAAKLKPDAINQDTRLSYRVSVQTNNTVLVGASYIKKLGMEKGDIFDIRIDPKNSCLILHKSE